jgi:Bardet-Biedl syndrome 7 protein
MDSHLEDASW